LRTSTEPHLSRQRQNKRQEPYRASATTASPDATGKSRSTFVDAALALNEGGKRFGTRLVLHRISQHARPLRSCSLVDLLTISGAQNDRGKRFVDSWQVQMLQPQRLASPLKGHDFLPPTTPRDRKRRPEFDKREIFGTSIEGAVPPSRVMRTPEDRIAEGDQVSLQYKNRQLFVVVIKIVAPEERYEGRVQGFADAPPALEINGLKAGCIVGLPPRRYLAR
jgi:hypothetical protein